MFVSLCIFFEIDNNRHTEAPKMTIRINSNLGDETSPNTTILYEHTFSTHLNISESTQYTNPVTMITATKSKISWTDRDKTTPRSLKLGIVYNQDLHDQNIQFTYLKRSFQIIGINQAAILTFIFYFFCINLGETTHEGSAGGNCC